MAWSESDYLSLKAAVASGVQEVQYNDRTVKYHSLVQMRSLLAEMEAALYGNTPGRSGGRYVATSKGV